MLLSSDMTLWKLVPLLEGPWEEGMSESWMVCTFLEELLWVLGSLVTLLQLQVLLFADAYKLIVDLVQHDKPACFPSLF